MTPEEQEKREESFGMPPEWYWRVWNATPEEVARLIEESPLRGYLFVRYSTGLPWDDEVAATFADQLRALPGWKRYRDLCVGIGVPEGLADSEGVGGLAQLTIRQLWVCGIPSEIRRKVEGP